MLLSLVILSYNRPLELQRILSNFVGVSSSDFNIIIKDDCSPLSGQIKKIVTSFSDLLEIPLLFYSNPKNLGYDNNLLDTFNIVDSKFVFLLSDDDYVIGSGFLDVVKIVKQGNFNFYFTPYNMNGTTFRTPSESVLKDNFSEIIYNSILFSGLVIRTSEVKKLNLDTSFLNNCIYSQVYLSMTIIYNLKSYGLLPSNILFVGGDGENFFGKNDSATNVSLLDNRKHFTSNLNYQSLLLLVVDRLSSDLDPHIGLSFSQEYRKRLIGYGFKSRALGIKNFLIFMNKLSSSPIRTRFNYMYFFFFLLFLVPSFISSYIYKISYIFLRKSG